MTPSGTLPLGSGDSPRRPRLCKPHEPFTRLGPLRVLWSTPPGRITREHAPSSPISSNTALPSTTCEGESLSRSPPFLGEIHGIERWDCFFLTLSRLRSPFQLEKPPFEGWGKVAGTNIESLDRGLLQRASLAPDKPLSWRSGATEPHHESGDEAD